MATVVSFPERGEVFLDARGEARTLRVSWHHDVGTVVFSLWRGAVCSGSFRLPADDVPALLAVLAGGLADVPAQSLADRPGQPVGAAGVRSKARGSGASTSPGSIAR
jgi:hypothetical protein